MQQTIIGRSYAFQCWFSVVGCSLAMTAAFDARAEPQYRIDLSAPKHLPACDDPDGFRGLLEFALSRNLLATPASRVLEIRIDKPTAADYVVNFALKELDGQVRGTYRQTYGRSLECFKVLYFLAVSAAVEMERDAPAEEKPPPPPPPPPPAVPPICPPHEEHRATPEKPFRPWFVGLGGVVEFGVAPESLVGVQFAGGWRWSPSWSLEAKVKATLPEDTRPLGPTVVRVYSVVSGTLGPCYRFGAFGLCGEVVVGNMWIKPLSLNNPQVDTALFWGAGARGFLEQNLSDRWSVRMDVNLFTPFLSAEIKDDRARDRWRTSVISGSASASMIVSF